MSQRKSEDRKLDINSLLSAYTTEEIFNVFTQIEQKISSLHQCASDDFLQLSSHFKSYFKDSKSIAENATQVFNFIAGDIIESNFNSINNILARFTDYFPLLDQSYGKSYINIEEIIYRICALAVHLNNYNQNLTTLKLVATNLELNSNYQEEKLQQLTLKKSQKLKTSIIKIKKLIPTLQKNLDSLKRYLESTLEELSIEKNDLRIQLESILNSIQTNISITRKRKENAIEKLPRLKEKTENTSKSIARIITNLQYHDIIRQKIDHIQQTHKEIIQELNELNEEGNKDSLHKVKFLFRIRDIAGLQAAQLILANKEYQEAIDVITLMFLDIGDDISAISQMSHEFAGINESENNTQLNSLNESIEQISEFQTLTSSIDGKYQFTIQTIFTKISEAQDVFRKIFDIEDELLTTVTEILNNLKKNKILPPKEVEHINSLSSDIKREFKSLNAFFVEANALTTELSNNIPFYSFSKETINYKTILTELEQVEKGLTNNHKKTFSILRSNKRMCEKVSTDIKKSIDQVKYYDFFEKVVEEMIDELNIVNLKLSSKDVDIEHDKEKNLRYLKQRYTMASEHEIHEKLANDDDTELIQNKIKIQKKEEDEDNIEFF